MIIHESCTDRLFTFPKSSSALVCTALPDVFINYEQFHV